MGKSEIRRVVRKRKRYQEDSEDGAVAVAPSLRHPADVFDSLLELIAAFESQTVVSIAGLERPLASLKPELEKLRRAVLSGGGHSTALGLARKGVKFMFVTNMSPTKKEARQLDKLNSMLTENGELLQSMRQR